MRFVLIDYARCSLARGGGGGADTAEHARSMLALHEALEGLSAANERMARVVECRFFGGLSEPEIAEVLGVSERVVRGDWQRAKIWLARDLGGRAR